MTTRQAHRVPRSTVPLTRPAPEAIAAPPQLGEGAGRTPVHFLLPVVGALSSMVMMVVLRNGQPLFLVVAAAVFLLAVVAGIVVAVSSRGQARRQDTQRRERYLDHLETLRADLRDRAATARSQAQAVHPSPAALPALVADPSRVWERRRRDADFLTVRLGTGAVPWFSLVLEPAPPMEPYDPMLAAQAAQLVEHGRRVDAMPVLADLADVSVMTIVGPAESARAAARAVLLQVTATHSPDDVMIAAAFAPASATEWAGLDLLPHTQDPRLFDGPVPARRVAPDAAALLDVLGHEITDRLARAKTTRGQAPDQPRLIVLCDDHGARASALRLLGGSSPHDLGITVVHVLSDREHEPDDVDLRLFLGPDGARVTTRPGRPEQTVQPVRPDLATLDLTATTARALAPLRMSRTLTRDDAGTPPSEPVHVLGVESLDDVGTGMWAPRGADELLRVPFGTDDLGRPVHLDLKEAGQGGMGPHGLCVGATGSGKSEMLRTLILALATTHSPEDLSMILVDYKGGAAFAPFATLPHLAGLIDNLADDPQLTTRARASIQGEVVRRQRLLKDVGAASIGHYRRLREDRPDLPPLPHLFVVIDEFAELLTAEPELVDLFLQIGRIGRSVGVHLLLSSQRVEAGKLRGLDTYLSYRLGLRTFSEGESQTVLGTSDAFSLPSLPGYGYLKVDTSVYTRFRAGYVSGPVPRERAAAPTDERPRALALPTYNHLAATASSTADGAGRTSAPTLTPIESGPTLIDEVVARLHDDGRAVRPVWLAPLPDQLALGRVLDTEATERLKVVVGSVDDPLRQTQEPWVLDLARAGGHLAVIGAPHAGRTTLLRTLVTSLALTHTPRAVAVYGMDLTGGGLSALEGFPHVGGVATRAHRDRIGRLVEELTATLTTRERVFREHGIESMTHLRALHEMGRVPELASADLVLVIDGYGAVRTELVELEEPLNALIAKGPGLGIHVVVGLTRWNELRIAQQSLFGTRVELRVAEPAESIIDRKLAGTITPETPGRALTQDNLLAHIALPVLDLVEPDAIGAEIQTLATRVAASWHGPAAAPIRLLPTRLDVLTLPDELDVPGAIPLGLRQDTMDTEFWAHLDDDQHLLVLADTKAGKSTTLRTIARGLAARYTDDELAIAVLGPRGQVAPAIPDDLLAADARTVAQAHGTALSIAAELAKRPGMEPEVRRRAPRIVVLVDDHDILVAGGQDPLTPLLPHLPSARDLGLHIVLTRPVAGTSRALYSPVLQSLRDTGAAVLLMSGDRAEGPIVGRAYAEHLPPGRGRYIRRGTAPFILQVACAQDATAGLARAGASQ